MPIEIIRNDLTTMKVDAIVNATDNLFSGSGGVDAMIHRAAGAELRAECRLLGSCAMGDAKITGAYRLPCKYVIHTVGPVWHGGEEGEEAALRSCYSRSLALAARHGCQTVAFPILSAGTFGYPRAQALRVAMDEISRFLEAHDMLVYLVVFDRTTFAISESLYASIAQYIDDQYADRYAARRDNRDAIFLQEVRNAPTIDWDAPQGSRFNTGSFAPVDSDAPLEADFFDVLVPYAAEAPTAPPPPIAAAPSPSLEDMLAQLDESFSQSVLRLIDERGMTDVDCYKRANMDRKHFSKLRSNVHYQPTKRTAVALAIALELSLPETQQLLAKAGFALSHTSKFDIIIEFFLLRGIYNIHEINEALFAFDQQPLGA